ncbi:MAG TPA: cold shock domain-containing protein [Candidatus Gracilibacteria bacterium]|nr:cold shock domain-containing protein [Candidatus Gracilibacteria bacterium]
MLRGTITRLGNGFGYICPEEPAKGDPEEILFHVSELVGIKFDALKVGDRVSFELDEKAGTQTLDAKKVQKLG